MDFSTVNLLPPLANGTDNIANWCLYLPHTAQTSCQITIPNHDIRPLTTVPLPF